MSWGSVILSAVIAAAVVVPLTLYRRHRILARGGTIRTPPLVVTIVFGFLFVAACAFTLFVSFETRK